MECTQIVDSEHIARKMAVDRKLETREKKFTFERLSETKSNLRARVIGREGGTQKEREGGGREREGGREGGRKGGREGGLEGGKVRARKRERA